MTIDEIKKTMQFICNHIDPRGRPIKGYYNIDEDIYYIIDEENNSFMSRKGSQIEDYLLFDPFSELKLIRRNQQ